MKSRNRILLKLAMCGLFAFSALTLLLSGATSTAAPRGNDPQQQPYSPQEPSTSPVAFKAADAALKIGYSDWPGWLVLEIAKQKGFFKDAGVEVELVWFADYGQSIDAFSAGKLDGIMIDCASSLTAKSSTIIFLTDYSNGNDMIIGKKGVDSFKDLKGKTVGLEENLVEHLLLAKALELNGFAEGDVKIKNVKTESTPGALKSGDVDAIGAWYPISGKALEEVANSKKLFTSAEAPGLIFDALQVDPASLAKRRADWKKVVGVWFKSLEYLNDKKTHEEAVKIMAKRVEAKPEDLEKNLKGTFLLDGPGNQKALRKRKTLDSVYGSLQNADAFFLKRKVYDKSVKTENMVDSSLVEEVLKK
jgi:NitT/TauT family transport system substrate-binding protein